MKNVLLKTLSICLVDLLYRLETAEDGQVNNDFAVSLMEDVATELQNLDEGELKKFIAIIRELAAGDINPLMVRYLNDFSNNFGLAE
ncbi:MAG: hypothetical protein ABF537_05475 [Acetobacter sp.]|uniref:hypothetical protein n=1 Tax=Acetobacter sp. TaxID=440 RepID=UPI0039EB442B